MYIVHSVTVHDNRKLRETSHMTEPSALTNSWEHRHFIHKIPNFAQYELFGGYYAN